MAISEIYVDPSIAADSGSGTIGDPFGDLEYAIKQTTFDTTNGTRVNIKSGTAEYLAAAISVAMADTGTSVAWVPSATAPLIFQGYTAAAGDGGRGAIIQNASDEIYQDVGNDWVAFVDLDLTQNTDFNALIFDNNALVINCSIDHNSTANNQYAINGDNGVVVINCYITSTSPHTSNDGAMIRIDGPGGLVRGCYLEGEDETTNGIRGDVHSVFIENNVVIVKTSANFGIYTSDNGCVLNNSIHCTDNDGTGSGIVVASGEALVSVMNNLVEGFSGTGGVGIEYAANHVAMTGGNAVYNCATEYSSSASVIKDWGNDETLTASPFSDASTGDFSPVETGSVKEGSLPELIGVNS